MSEKKNIPGTATAPVLGATIDKISLSMGWAPPRWDEWGELRECGLGVGGLPPVVNLFWRHLALADSLTVVRSNHHGEAASGV